VTAGTGDDDGRVVVRFERFRSAVRQIAAELESDLQRVTTARVISVAVAS